MSSNSTHGSSALASCEEDENRYLLRWDSEVCRRSRKSSRRSHRGALFDAEDLAQEARLSLLLANRSRPQIHDGYARRVIGNSFVTEWRRSTHTRITFVSLEQHLIDPGELEADFLAHRAVAAWVSSLPSNLQTFFELIYELGYTQRKPPR